MKFLVFGSGAIGSVFGGLLAENGHEATLLGRAGHMEAVTRHGLRISGIWGDHLVKNMRAVSDYSKLDTGDYDVILCSVRAYDTSGAAPRIAELINDKTLVVSLQNGLGNWEALGKHIPPGQLVGARVIFGAKIPEPGHAVVTVYAEEVMLGSPGGDMEYSVIERLAGIINEAGIPTLPTHQINEFLWAKVLYNSALNPLSAILDRTYGELAEDDNTRLIMDNIIREIFSVASKRGIPLFWEKPEGYLGKFYDEEVPPTAGHRSSMLQAIEKGLKTEIDSLNGAIVRMAAESGLNVPVNETIVRLIYAKENKS